jgi:outer membrane protein
MKRLSIILFLVPALAAHAQQSWNLKQCIEYAIANNVTVKQAANTADQSAVEVNTAKWSRLPNLNGSAGQGWNWGRTASPIDNTYTDVHNASTSFAVGTSIPLFTGLRYSYQYALSKVNLQAAVEDLNTAKEDISINIASAYLQALLYAELDDVAKSQVELTRKQYERTSRLYDAGKAAPAEVAESKSRLAQEEMNAVQADNNYKLAMLDLSQLLELPSPEGFTIDAADGELDFVPLSAPDAIYNDALISKPSIRAARLRLDGSAYSIRVAQSSYYPSLNLNANISTNYYTIGGVISDSFGRQMKNNLNKYVGLSLSVPIFNRFATRNSVRTARLQQQNMVLQLDATKKALYKEVQQAWYNAVAAESQYISSVNAVEASQATFDLTEQKLENGKATLLEFDEAKQNLKKALSDRIQAKYDYLFRCKILDFYKGVSLE